MASSYDYRMVAMQKDCNRLVNVQDRLSLNGYIKVHFTKDLTLNADYHLRDEERQLQGLQQEHLRHELERHKAHLYIVSLTNSDATRYNTKSNRWTANAYLDYVHTFLNDHNVHVMLGVNAEDYTSDYFYARRKQLYDEKLRGAEPRLW
jgi:hypothetical protein